MTAPTRRHRRASARRAYAKHVQKARASRERMRQRRQYIEKQNHRIMNDLAELRNRHRGQPLIYLEKYFHEYPKEYRFLYHKGFRLSVGPYMFTKVHGRFTTFVTLSDTNRWKGTTKLGYQAWPTYFKNDVRELLTFI